MRQRTKDNAEAWRKWISATLILLIPVVQGYYANRNDDNAIERTNKLRQEQWAQRRAADSLFKVQTLTMLDSVKHWVKHR